jgi:hypothetical protein
MKKLIPLLTLFVFATYACSNDDDTTAEAIPCTDAIIPALKVVVTNARTGAGLSTGVAVTATDGEYIGQLSNAEMTNEFYGVDEREGTYTITVTAAGYQPYSSPAVTVTKDECHVITQTVTVALQPVE